MAASLKLATFALLALGAVFWLVSLAGLAALEDKCETGCRHAYGLPWWVVWFELVMLIVVGAATVANNNRHRLPVLTLLGVLTVLTTLVADGLLDAKDTRSYDGGQLFTFSINDRLNCAIAGFLVLTILNMLLIIVHGSDTDRVDAAVPTKPAVTHHHNPVAQPGVVSMQPVAQV